MLDHNNNKNNDDDDDDDNLDGDLDGDGDNLDGDLDGIGDGDDFFIGKRKIILIFTFLFSIANSVFVVILIGWVSFQFAGIQIFFDDYY